MVHKETQPSRSRQGRALSFGHRVVVSRPHSADSRT